MQTPILLKWVKRAGSWQTVEIGTTALPTHITRVLKNSLEWTVVYKLRCALLITNKIYFRSSVKHNTHSWHVILPISIHTWQASLLLI